MSFNDYLNGELPSKSRQSLYDDLFTEADDDVPGLDALDNLDKDDQGQSSTIYDAREDSDYDDDDDDDDNTVGDDDVDDVMNDDDVDDMDDDELMQLDSELSNDALSSAAGADGEGEVKLSPDEEIKADDMMSVAATTMLVKDELNAEEKAEFVTSSGDIAINEGFMTDADVREIAAESTLVNEKAFYNKNMVRMTREARFKQLYALAVNVSAAAHNDPDYRKLKKVMKMRKILRAKLEKKYHSEANKRAKVYMARLKRSKSQALKKLAK